MMPTPRNMKSIGRHLLVNFRLGTFIYPTTTPLLQWSTVLVPTIRALPPTPPFAAKNRYSDTVKYFVEYYAEEETAAITVERAGSEVFDTDASGGSAQAAGVSLNLAW
jgi:hypothetical protein